MQHFSSNCCR